MDDDDGALHVRNRQRLFGFRRIGNDRKNKKRPHKQQLLGVCTYAKQPMQQAQKSYQKSLQFSEHDPGPSSCSEIWGPPSFLVSPGPFPRPRAKMRHSSGRDEWKYIFDAVSSDSITVALMRHCDAKACNWRHTRSFPPACGTLVDQRACGLHLFRGPSENWDVREVVLKILDDWEWDTTKFERDIIEPIRRCCPQACVGVHLRLDIEERSGIMGRSFLAGLHAFLAEHRQFSRLSFEFTQSFFWSGRNPLLEQFKNRGVHMCGLIKPRHELKRNARICCALSHNKIDLDHLLITGMQIHAEKYLREFLAGLGAIKHVFLCRTARPDPFWVSEIFRRVSPIGTFTLATNFSSLEHVSCMGDTEIRIEYATLFFSNPDYCRNGLAKSSDSDNDYGTDSDSDDASDSDNDYGTDSDSDDASDNDNGADDDDNNNHDADSDSNQATDGVPRGDNDNDEPSREHNRHDDNSDQEWADACLGIATPLCSCDSCRIVPAARHVRCKRLRIDFLRALPGSRGRIAFCKVVSALTRNPHLVELTFVFYHWHGWPARMGAPPLDGTDSDSHGEKFNLWDLHQWPDVFARCFSECAPNILFHCIVSANVGDFDSDINNPRPPTDPDELARISSQLTEFVMTCANLARFRKTKNSRDLSTAAATAPQDVPDLRV